MTIQHFLKHIINSRGNWIIKWTFLATYFSDHLWHVQIDSLHSLRILAYLFSAYFKRTLKLRFILFIINVKQGGK